MLCVICAEYALQNYYSWFMSPCGFVCFDDISLNIFLAYVKSCIMRNGLPDVPCLHLGNFPL